MHEEEVQRDYQDEDKRKALRELLEYWDDDKLIGFSIADQILIKKVYKRIKLLERESKIGSLDVKKLGSESIFQKITTYDPETQKLVKIIQGHLRQSSFKQIASNTHFDKS